MSWNVASLGMLNIGNGLGEIVKCVCSQQMHPNTWESSVHTHATRHIVSSVTHGWEKWKSMEQCSTILAQKKMITRSPGREFFQGTFAGFSLPAAHPAWLEPAALGHHLWPSGQNNWGEENPNHWGLSPGKFRKLREIMGNPKVEFMFYFLMIWCRYGDVVAIFTGTYSWNMMECACVSKRYTLR